MKMAFILDKLRMRLYLIYALILFISINLCAQERYSGEIEIIPNIGYSSSFLNGDNVENLKAKSALQFGVIGDYYFNDRWSLRSGLSYFGMGATIPESKLQLDYLHIPLNANWHFGNTRKWNLNFGVAPGFLLSGEVNGEDVKEFYKLFQLAISYGLGYKIEISDTFNLIISGQGLFGVTNIIEDSQDFKRLNAGSSINVGGVFIL